MLIINFSSIFIAKLYSSFNHFFELVKTRLQKSPRQYV